LYNRLMEDKIQENEEKIGWSICSGNRVVSLIRFEVISLSVLCTVSPLGSSGLICCIAQKVLLPTQPGFWDPIWYPKIVKVRRKGSTTPVFNLMIIE